MHSIVLGIVQIEEMAHAFQLHLGRFSMFVQKQKVGKETIRAQFLAMELSGKKLIRELE